MMVVFCFLLFPFTSRESVQFASAIGIVRTHSSHHTPRAASHASINRSIGVSVCLCVCVCAWV